MRVRESLCVWVNVYVYVSVTLPPSHAAAAINLLGNVSHLSPTELDDMGIGLCVGILWEEALHAALMPVTPQCSMGSLAESESPSHLTTHNIIHTV